MRLGEICLLTQDVPRLAAFYRTLLDVHEESADPVHQTIIATETMLTILHDDHAGDTATAAITFSVEDVEAEYRRLLSLGMTILQPPEKKPWGAVNMIVQDPDGHAVYLHTLPSHLS